MFFMLAIIMTYALHMVFCLSALILLTIGSYNPCSVNHRKITHTIELKWFDLWSIPGACEWVKRIEIRPNPSTHTLRTLSSTMHNTLFVPHVNKTHTLKQFCSWYILSMNIYKYNTGAVLWSNWDGSAIW